MCKPKVILSAERHSNKNTTILYGWLKHKQKCLRTIQTNFKRGTKRILTVPTPQINHHFSYRKQSEHINCNEQLLSSIVYNSLSCFNIGNDNSNIS